MCLIRNLLTFIVAAGLHAGAMASHTVDTAALMEDVRILASTEFAGRKTGTAGSKLAQDFLVKRFAALGLQPFGANYLMPFSFTHTSIRQLAGAGKTARTHFPSAANVVGFIRGSKHPDRYLVVSAHYDHLGSRNDVVYHGADDNASGVASMLAVAAHFRRHPPDNTIVFAAFDAEELALQGAEAFVRALPFPRERLVMNLNLDMVSRNANNEIWVAGVFHTPAFKPLVEAAAGRSTVRVRQGHDKPPLFAASVEDWSGSSDHGAFHAAGAPFLYFGVDDHPDYHQPGDTADKIDPVFYTNVTKLLVDVASMLDLNLHTVR